MPTIALAKEGFFDGLSCFKDIQFCIMYYVYLLHLADNSIYTGSTKDIKKRLEKHTGGNVLATKGKRPVELVYYCAFPSKVQALIFEKYLKSGSGQAFRNRHLI